MSDNFFVAFDLETTGLNFINDRILTAAVSGLPEGDYYLILNPGIPVPAEATAVHGITTEFVAANGVPYSEGLDQIGQLLISAWSRGATVVGHNVLEYDLPMLRMQERATFGCARTEFGAVFDTLHVFRKQHPGMSAKLANACSLLGVVLDNAHNAAADARASLELAHILASN